MLHWHAIRQVLWYILRFGTPALSAALVRFFDVPVIEKGLPLRGKCGHWEVTNRAAGSCYLQRLERAGNVVTGLCVEAERERCTIFSCNLSMSPLYY